MVLNHHASVPLGPYRHCPFSNLLVVIGLYSLSSPLIVPSEHSLHTAKGILHPKMTILSSFTHPHVVPKKYDFHLSFCETKMKICVCVGGGGLSVVKSQ